MVFIEYIQHNWVGIVVDIIVGLLLGSLPIFFQKDSSTNTQCYTFHHQIYHIKEIVYMNRPSGSRGKKKQNGGNEDFRIYLFASVFITLLFIQHKTVISHFILSTLIITTSGVLSFILFLVKRKLLKGLNLYYTVALAIILTASYIMFYNLWRFDVKVNGGLAQLITEIGISGFAVVITKVIGYLLWVMMLLLIPIIILHIWLAHSQFLNSSRGLQFLFRKTAFVTTNYKFFIPYLIVVCFVSWFFSSGTYGNVFTIFIGKLASILLDVSK
jgi:hypothetical protein